MPSRAAEPSVTPPTVPVRRIGKAFEQVADQLRELITTGVLAPGQRLPTEATLSDQFGVSRATVREALRLLSAQNLVRTAKGVGGGSYVNVPTVAHISRLVTSNLSLMRAEVDVEAFLEARELLEVPAARLAAIRISAADVEALEATIPEQPLDLSLDEQFVHNRAFHFQLVRAACNPLLSIAAEPVFDMLRMQHSPRPASKRIVQAINAEHREIADALRAGDADAAEGAMRRHLETLRPGYRRTWRRV